MNPEKFYDIAFKTVDGVKKCGFTDIKGKWLIEPRFDAVEIFLTGKDHTNAKLNGLWGYINRKGEWEPMD